MKKMNDGKQFEIDFKKSVPRDCFYYRLRDGTASWSADKSNTRFQATNDFDCLIFNSNVLYCLELKSQKANRVELKRIRKNQAKGLERADSKNNVVAGLILNFRSVEETYFLSYRDYQEFVENSTRKSIPISYCREKGVRIAQRKLKVSYRYGIREFMEGIESRSF